MFEIVIELDEKKINKEKIYDIDEMKRTLLKMAERAFLLNSENLIFIGVGESANGFSMALLNTLWFINNVSKWEY